MERKTVRASGSPAGEAVGEGQGVEVQRVEDAVEHPPPEGALLAVPGFLGDVGDVRHLLDEDDAVHPPTLASDPTCGQRPHGTRFGPSGPPTSWSRTGAASTRTRSRPSSGRRGLVARARPRLGSHSHWAGPLELVRGRLVVYSLGDLVFDLQHDARTQQGIIAELTFAGRRLAQVELHPTLIPEPPNRTCSIPTGAATRPPGPGELRAASLALTRPAGAGR